jgi:hypothetical protein
MSGTVMPLITNKSVPEGAAGLVYACLCPIAPLEKSVSGNSDVVHGGDFLDGTRVAVAHRNGRDRGMALCVCVCVCMCVCMRTCMHVDDLWDGMRVAVMAEIVEIYIYA